jgi:uncharacterized protein (TIRG00374 family)
MRRIVTRHIIPWIITLAAIFFVSRDIDVTSLLSFLKQGHAGLLTGAVLITICSYMFRARRWQVFLPTANLNYKNSLTVLIFGFLMNNLLPARAGEFVRAHLGAKIAGCSKTFVLATIASERIADGLCLSGFFLIFGLSIESGKDSVDFRWVTYAFALVSVIVVTLILSKKQIFYCLDILKNKFDYPAFNFLLSRIRLFLEGFEPLREPSALLTIFLWSIFIWTLELLVFYSVGSAYGGLISLHTAVLFMVSSNFSSLIPSAPGAIGVIEAVATEALVASGIERELALAMVLTQHCIQFLVTGLGGSIAFQLIKKQVYSSVRTDIPILQSSKKILARL